MCERDMLRHFDVESQLFIPAVERMESEMRRSATDVAGEGQADDDVTSAQLALLSEREKEILRGIAQERSTRRSPTSCAYPCTPLPLTGAISAPSWKYTLPPD